VRFIQVKRAGFNMQRKAMKSLKPQFQVRRVWRRDSSTNSSTTDESEGLYLGTSRQTRQTYTRRGAWLGLYEIVAGHPTTARTHPTSRKTITNPPATNQRRSGTTVPRETGTKSSSTAMNL
jgi:hypothetical protein